VWARVIGWAVVMLLVGIGVGFLVRLLWPRTPRSRTSVRAA
jgi:hypothetical protein